MSRGTFGVCVCVGLVLTGVLVLSGMAVGTSSTAEDTQNASLGADISSFMQASSVETADDVEEGTFEAALNRTEDPDARRALIEARQARLQERSERLRAQHEGLGNAFDVRNRSIATRVSVGSVGLERSANRTEEAASAAGVDTEPLAEVRSNARSIRGSGVSELARSVAGPPGLSDSPSDADWDSLTDTRDAERGPTGIDSGKHSAANSSASTDRPGENGTPQAGNNSAHDRGGGPDNTTGPNGSPPDGVSGAVNGDRSPPEAANNASSGFPVDRIP